MSDKAIVSFRVDEEAKKEFEENVPTASKAMREFVHSYLDDPDMSLEERINSTRRSILRMHKTRLETEVEGLKDHLEEINEMIGEVEEDPKVIHKIDMSDLYENE